MALQFKLCKDVNNTTFIYVFREQYDTDTQSLACTVLPPLSTFDHESIQAFIKTAALDIFEQFQLHQYVESMRFSQQVLKAELSELQPQFSLHTTLCYQQAIFELWQLAKAHHLDFNPGLTQARALFNKAKAVERELNKHLGQPVKILEKIGIDISVLSEDELKQRMSETGQALFKLMATSAKASPSELCHTFNQIAAERYQKNVHFKPSYLKTYANQLRRYPLWYCTVAIDVLMHYGINPTHQIPAINIAEHWIRLKEAHYSPQQAAETFIADFQIPLSEQEAVKMIIQQHYEKGLSTANA